MRLATLGSIGAAALALGCVSGCADEGSTTRADFSGTATPPMGQRLAAGGAQDIGEFRRIVESGGLPAPSTLDSTGFFAEHAIGAPPSSCDSPVCAEAALAVMGNMLNGMPCTLVRVSLSTAGIDEAPKPASLVIALDRYWQGGADWNAMIGPGLDVFLGSLGDDDRVSLVTLTGELLIEDATPRTVRELLERTPPTARYEADVYAGLVRAYDLARAHAGEDREPQVLLISSGEATTGITAPDYIAQLVAETTDVATTVIGFGDADSGILDRIAATGAARSFFMGTEDDAREIFAEELRTSLTPIARDVEITLDAGTAYEVRAVQGVRSARFDPASTTAHLPMLAVASRSDDGTSEGATSLGRRGGGGVLLFELTPREPLPEGADPYAVGLATLRYVDARTGESHDQKITVTNTFRPGFYPEGGLFADAEIEKAFVALNVLVAFRMMAASVERGAYEEALATGTQLGDNVDGWLETHDDVDIEDDTALLDRFMQNVSRVAPTTRQGVAPPPPVWRSWTYE